MSSYQLSPSAPSEPTVKVPVYASFAPTKDIMIVLYEDGLASLWNLHTRLGPGKGKVMDPEAIWHGQVSETSALWRQATVFVTEPEDGEDQPTYRIMALGAPAGNKDVVATTVIRNGEVKARVKETVERNGRLIQTTIKGCFWQSREGEVLQGLFLIIRTYIFN